MINLKGYNEVATGGISLPPGGYLAYIVNARLGVFQDGTEALFVYVDITDGEFAGFFKSDFDRLKKFAPAARWSEAGTIKLPLVEDGRIHWRLKKFLEVVKHDNPDLNIVPDSNFDELSLIGKSCGIVVAHKENKRFKSDGSHWTNPYVAYAVTADAIRSGDFSVPATKKYQSQASSAANPPTLDYDDFGGESIDHDDPPF